MTKLRALRCRIQVGLRNCSSVVKGAVSLTTARSKRQTRKNPGICSRKTDGGYSREDFVLLASRKWYSHSVKVAGPPGFEPGTLPQDRG